MFQQLLIEVMQQKCTFHRSQMTDIQKGLLLGKGKKQSKQYARRFDQCELKIVTLKNKNNELQRQCDQEMESDIRHAIKQQATFLQKQIVEIKNIITKLSREYTDPNSKHKIKDLWNMAGKEIERNKRIMAQFVNRSSTYPSFIRRSSMINTKEKAKNDMPRSKAAPNQQPNKQQYSSLIEGQQIDDGELQLQKRILAQKNALLKEIEEKNNKINKLYNQMGSILAGEQRDMLNQIDQNLGEVKQNLVHANQELGEAVVYQKKSKKKYICLGTFLVIVILATAGIIYFFVT